LLAPRRQNNFVHDGITPQASASLAEHHVLSVFPGGEAGASVKVGQREICRICERAPLDQHEAHGGWSKAARLDQWQMSINDQQRPRHTQEQHSVASDEHRYSKYHALGINLRDTEYLFVQKRVWPAAPRHHVGGFHGR
jgi:hypothetical protein